MARGNKDADKSAGRVLQECLAQLEKGNRAARNYLLRRVAALRAKTRDPAILAEVDELEREIHLFLN